MSTVLALDTCDRTIGVAVAVGGEVRCWRVEHSAQRHSVRLLALVEETLAGAAAERGDLDGIAVTRGPGSFTGVRVGVAAAKGLAFALGLPVVGVSSLEALWRGAVPFPGAVVPVLDARKGQVYATARQGLEGGGTLLGEGAWDPGEVLGALAEERGPCLFLGSGLEPYRETFARALGERFLEASRTRWAIHPGDVALAGWEALQRGEGVVPAALTPTYRRLSEAEEVRRRGVAAKP
ncbi:MAG: tRNA (adenosine(37)-N6)-threonylcarbamoyltransferase complex dimerization subunit type 1 TsaB [Deferrisomatales bacterium]|nr:tRNA (adenosine(37)-N6)-threonylcarbamoyltransferase complex dimerization subunit type 1 TsaB [Deferrisomatales bacterium]